MHYYYRDGATQTVANQTSPTTARMQAKLRVPPAEVGDHMLTCWLWFLVMNGGTADEEGGHGPRRCY